MTGKHFWTSLLAPAAALAIVLAVRLVVAQSTCPYAEFRLDTEVDVDVDAICQAAKPWSDKGFRVFVFLTDRKTANEDEWFALLDQVEADAGLRDLNQEDGFAKNALAFEAATDPAQGWACSITYGESLFGSRLDKDEAALAKIKEDMCRSIAAGEFTAAFADALRDTYETNYPPPSPWLKIGGIAIGGGGLVLLIIGLVKVAIDKLKHRRMLKQHRDTLMTLTSNLLLACDRLLSGDTPEDTVLYQLFAANGGDRYPKLRDQVLEWLRRSRAALDDAFDLRQRLIHLPKDKSPPLEQQVHDWEMLYITLVGSNERILSMSNDELHTLLDPLLTLEQPVDDVLLVEQLDEVRQRLAGVPLKVEFQMIDPAKTDAEGILGYVGRVKGEIARLQKTRLAAPDRLADVRRRREQVAADVPDYLKSKEKQLFARIDDRLARAARELEDGLFLRVVERVERINSDLDLVESFLKEMAEHAQREAEIGALRDQGYRPPRLDEYLGEVRDDVRETLKLCAAGKYADAVRWVQELAQDSQRALDEAQRWKQLQEENASALSALRERLERVASRWHDECSPAWEQLCSYPSANWQDLSADVEEAEGTLRSLGEERLSQIERLNSLEVQDFAAAGRMLAQAATDLERVEACLDSVIHRLEQVRAAEAKIEQSLQLAEEAINKAQDYRDRQDAKVGPDVDRQILDARARLEEARRLAAERAFLDAMAAQGEARQLAQAAYKAANEQVKEIDRLQKELQQVARRASSRLKSCRDERDSLPTTARSEEIGKLIRKATQDLAAAASKRAALSDLQDRELAKALQAGIAAYRAVIEEVDQIIDQVRSDYGKYKKTYDDAQRSVRWARLAIERAERDVHSADARGAGSRSLQRARRLLPAEPKWGDEPAELQRTRRDAERARHYAEIAADEAKREARATRSRRVRSRSSRGSSGSSFTLFTTSGSRGSSSSGRGSYRRSTSSSSRGSSRRSSSRGSSRRSSSYGRSRRR